MKLRKVEFFQKIVEYLVVVAIICLTIYSTFLSFSHWNFEKRFSQTPEFEISYNLLDVKLTWNNGIYVAMYKFQVIKDNKRFDCEFEEVPKEDYIFQKSLKLKIIDGKVYRTTNNGEEIKCH